MANDDLAGKQVACPSCGGPLLITRPRAAAAANTATSATANSAGGPVAVTCVCGKSYAAAAALRGSSVRCPACGTGIRVPAASPVYEDPFIETASDGGFGAGPAWPTNAGGSQFAAPQPSYSYPTATPGQAWRPKESRTPLIVALSMGGFVVAGLLIAVIAMNVLPGREEVAFKPEPRAKPPAKESADSVPIEEKRANSLLPPPSASPSLPTSPSASTSPSLPSTSGSPPFGNNSAIAPISPPGNIASPNGPTPPAGFGFPSANAGNLPPALKPSDRTGRSPNSSVPGGASAPKSKPEVGSDDSLPDGLIRWHGSNTYLRGLTRQGDIDVPWAQYSFFCNLLPHLGHQKLFDEMDFRAPLDKNLKYGTAIVPQFLNPADDRTRCKGFPYQGLATTHFVGMSGVEDRRNVVAATLPRSDPRAGIFGYDAVASRDDITDGASQTIMMIGSGELASPWLLGGGATIRGAREPHFAKLSGFGSRGKNSAGALAVFADGSVRHISANVDPSVFRAACTIHGAETVDLNSYASAATLNNNQPRTDDESRPKRKSR